MFIQVQGTPNPASNMFVPGRPVLDVSLSKAGRLFDACFASTTQSAAALPGHLAALVHAQKHISPGQCITLLPAFVSK